MHLCVGGVKMALYNTGYGRFGTFLWAPLHEDFWNQLFLHSQPSCDYFNSLLFFRNCWLRSQCHLGFQWVTGQALRLSKRLVWYCSPLSKSSQWPFQVHFGATEWHWFPDKFPFRPSDLPLLWWQGHARHSYDSPSPWVDSWLQVRLQVRLWPNRPHLQIRWLRPIPLLRQLQDGSAVGCAWIQILTEVRVQDE